MLVTKTPLRVSFFGGGSDLPVYFSEHTGRVVSAAIDKYIYICMNRQFENGFYLRYSDSEKVSNIDEIRHRIFRASLGLFPATKDVEITSLADIPSYGAGLGSSSSFTVGLLKLLAEYTGIALGHRELAQMACKVELEILKEPIGLQDQYAAAYGGMNNFEFFKNSVRVTPISLSADFQSRLNSSFLLIFTGGTRSASQELKGQQDRISASNQAKNVISSFVQYAESFFKMMLAEDLSGLKELFDDAWSLKKSLSPTVVNTATQSLRNDLLEFGVYGMKVLGAGNGGFMLVYASEEKIEVLKKKLGNKAVTFGISKHGAISSIV